MKLLRVTASNFKNCSKNYTIDFVAKSRKTSEDKEYELQEIAPGLFVFNTMAFIGKNASGKTTALELLDCVYSILERFRLSGKHYSYDGIELQIFFYHNNKVFLYETKLNSDKSLENKAVFESEKIYSKPYYKSKIKSLFDVNTFMSIEITNVLPEDISNVYMVLGKTKIRAMYFDSYDDGDDTFELLFKIMNFFNLEQGLLSQILKIFDENIQDLKQLNDHDYKLVFKGKELNLTDKQLIHRLSSGTKKGVILYLIAALSLMNGFDLVVDEIENHFHKTLVENLISLYKDKTVNRHNATLMFSTHYCEVLDLMGRQDNIWICRAEKTVCLSNMYEDYNIRPELLKSKQYYCNAFQTSVNYEELMNLKRILKK